MKPKLKQLPEVGEHLAMLFDDDLPMEEAGQLKVKGQAEAARNLRLLLTHLDDAAAWTGESIQASITATATEAGVKPGALMFPLRLLLTGATHGVDLLPALVLLGRSRVLARLTHRLNQLFP